MVNIALVGAGNIGLRHAQSLASDLTNFEISLDIFEQSSDRKETLSRELPREFKFNFYECLNQGRENYDVVIIATTSGVRKRVIDEFLQFKKCSFYILEKVLLTSLEELEDLLLTADKNNSKFFVNCNLRSTVFYKKFKEEVLAIESLEKMEVNGSSWGLGCNCIHFLDLFSFFKGDQKVSSVSAEIKKVIPAKRSGYNEFIGSFNASIGDSALHLSCSEGEFNLAITLKTNRNTYSFEDTCEGLLITSSNSEYDKMEKVIMPFQSQMTLNQVKKLIESHDCDLPELALSGSLHRLMLEAFKTSLGTEEDKCKIT